MPHCAYILNSVKESSKLNVRGPRTGLLGSGLRVGADRVGYQESGDDVVSKYQKEYLRLRYFCDKPDTI